MLFEVLQSQQAACYTLVVAKEQEVHAGEDPDCNLQLGATKAQVVVASAKHGGGIPLLGTLKVRCEKMPPEPGD